MSVLDKFKKGAVKAGIQASGFFKESSSRVQSSSQSFAQGFSLPGEAEKAAKILESFLGSFSPRTPPTFHSTSHRATMLNPFHKLTPPTPNPLSTRFPRPSCSVHEVGAPFTSHTHNPPPPTDPHDVLFFLFLPPNLGLAVFQVLKAGFVFSGKAGSGLVIARLPDGSWSAPSCIATGGVGWGLQIGADITDFVIVLNSEDAVRAFSLGGNVTIGGNVSATAGPIGTGGSVQASLAHPAPMFSYSKSKGALFIPLKTK